jgi:hypothetical protein
MNKLEAAFLGLTFLHLIILVLGTFSYTRLVTADKFPLSNWFRDKVYSKYPPTGHTMDLRPTTEGVVSMSVSQGQWYVTKGHWGGELISCGWCFSFWVGLFVSVGYLFAPTLTLVALFPMALRAASGIISYNNGG